MANACSVILRKRKAPRPTAANLIHVLALRIASYWLEKNPQLQVSEVVARSIAEANRVWKEWEKSIEERYKKIRGRKLRSDAVKIEEGLVVIGTDVADRDNPEKQKQLIENFVKKFEKKYNTKVLLWAIHDHEGKDEDHKNLHTIP